MSESLAETPEELFAASAAAVGTLGATLTPQEQLAAQPTALAVLWGHGRWIAGWAAKVAEFGFVQCWVQLFTGVAGLLIIRALAKEQYAFYAIANQMQTACNLLAELGIGVGVRSIGGRVWQDRRRLGELVQTALGLRRWFALFSIGGCLPVAAWMLRRNGADWPTIVALCIVLVASVLPLLTSSVLTIVPQLHGEYRRIQKLDFGNGLLRLGMAAGLYATRMNAWLAAAIGAVNNFVQMTALRPWAREHADPEAATSAEDRRQLLDLSVRTFPNTLFFCFQGQVTLLILTLVGNSGGIADVTALGRLAVLLMAFSTAFSNVLVPRFARCQDARRLPRLYFGLVGATIALLAPVLAVAWVHPGPLLWILGQQYAGLEAECRLACLIACVNQLVSVIWQLNLTKAWIHIQAFAYIPTLVAAQVIGALVLDLHRFYDVLLFALITVAAPLPPYLADSIAGMRRLRRSPSDGSGRPE